MKSLLFIINPSAGRTHIKNRLFDVIDAFSRAGYWVHTFPTKAKYDARNVVIEQGKNYDLIVCAGGDGTLDDTVAGMMTCNCKVPLGYIPAGTTNDFARSLNIPREPMPAVENIIYGKAFNIDIGSLNGQYFVYVAAFGAFTEVSYSTPQVYKNYFGHAAYILEGIKSLTSIKGYDIEVEFGDKRVSGNYMYGMITNSLSVGGFKSIGNRYVEFDDGLFEVVLIKTPTNAMDLQSIMSALLLNEINEDFMFSFKAANIKLRCEEDIPWTLDGEYGGDHKEVEIINHQRQISIMNME